MASMVKKVKQHNILLQNEFLSDVEFAFFVAIIDRIMGLYHISYAALVIAAYGIAAKLTRR